MNNIKVGAKFKICKLTCQDNDLLDWYDDQPSEVLVVESYELETQGVWVSGCDFRIDMSEIILL